MCSVSADRYKCVVCQQIGTNFLAFRDLAFVGVFWKIMSKNCLPGGNLR